MVLLYASRLLRLLKLMSLESFPSKIDIFPRLSRLTLFCQIDSTSRAQNKKLRKGKRESVTSGRFDVRN